MLMMWKVWSARKVRRTVVAENPMIVCILVVIAVIQWDHAVFYHHDDFVNFQQMTLLKAQTNSQVSPLWCQNFFGVALDIGIAAPENSLLNSSQILRQSLMQHRAVFSPDLDVYRDSGGNHSPTPQTAYYLIIGHGCIGQKTFLSPCAANFRRDSI